MKRLCIALATIIGLHNALLGQSGWTVQNSGATSVLYSVKAIDENVGWFAGLGGVVGRTIDGGNTWQQVGNATIPDIYSMEAVDANTALVAATTSPSGGNTYIYRTSNGGASWEIVYSLVASGAFIDCIKMFNAQYGIAVTDPVNSQWVILKTTDGGASWSRLPNEPVQIGSEWGAPHCLFLVSQTDIRFVAGASGTRMYRSTDGGETWSNYPLPFGSNQYSLSLWFNTPLIGIAGSSSTAIARTSDGGITWNPLSLPGPGTWGLSGFDSTFFGVNWATIYVSTDNGMSWSESYQPGFGQLADISFVKRAGVTRGWAIGGYASIATYYEPVTSVNVGGTPENPLRFDLAQNYPNPFNPVTTIQYEIPATGHLSLTVYNILGQQVAMLVDEVVPAGRFQVEWNAGKAASGVYLCRLTSGRYSRTMKMVVAK